VTGTLPIANGGTGTTSTTFANLQSNVSGTLPVANGGTGVTSSTGSGNNVLSNSPTLVTPVLGTPSSGTLTSCTGLPLTTGVTGTLPVGNGGSGATTFTANNVLLGNGTSAFQVVAPGSNGNVLTSNGSTWTSAALSGGVTSLNGQTGAITNNTYQAVGSYAVLIAFTGSVAPGGTASGANLGYVSSGGGNAPSYSLASGQARNGNTTSPGSGANSYNVNTTAVSGTWRIMNGYSGRRFECCTTFADPNLWIRIS
jgi:hypothetical protein